MSKRGYISRYLLIIKRLRLMPYSSYEELQGYINKQLDYLQMQDDTLNIGFSKRTLQRDVREIRNLFGIDIEYSKSRKGYFITQDEAENMNFQRMIEAFDMFNSLNMAQGLTPFVHLEPRRSQGTENLNGLLHGIKNRLCAKFDYQKFWEDEITKRIAEPLALKEFKNRWYVISRDKKDGKVKSFALDRISEFEIVNEKFEYPHDYSVEQSYRYSFGIISSDNQQPSDVVLSFSPYQGKYIKTLPLHHTQQVLIDDETELRIGLKVHITYDFLMEILSYGSEVKVLEPTSLIDEVKQNFQAALNQY